METQRSSPLALNDTPPRRDIGIAKVVQHPLWNKRTLANDIAILALASKVEFRPGVVPACMPDEYRGRLGYNKQAVVKDYVLENKMSD